MEHKNKLSVWRIFFLGTGMSLMAVSASAQQAKSEIREGNRLFKAEKFEDSEIAYRKAIDAETSSVPGNFNLGGALYRQEKFEEAEEQFSMVSRQNTSREVQSNAYHNLGNTYLQAGKLDEAIDSYKEALRRNPSDMETKYNLAYAQKLKQEQEQQQQQQNQDQQNQDQQNQDQQNQDQQNQDQQNQDQQNQDQQNQDQQNQDQQNQQQQGQEQKISKSDAERMLNALANDEKATQEKVKKAKALAKRVRTLKDW